MAQDKQLSESLEDYLEIILELEKGNKVARVKDIAEKMGIQSGSVTSALKNLAEKKLINYEPYSYITLTESGMAIAKEMNMRHVVIQDFLSRVLQIDEKQADETACRMEHTLDKKSFGMIVQFIKFIDECPRTGDGWKQAFIHSCKPDADGWKKCKACLSQCSEKLK